MPEERGEKARALVKEIMEGALQLDVPLVADAAPGLELGRGPLGPAVPAQLQVALSAAKAPLWRR